MKRKNDALLIGVIYPKVKKYLEDYCKSIESQDMNRFDILILNDGFTENFTFKDDRLTTINIQSKITPAEIRMLGIKYVLENDYKYVIFSDSDDYFSSNRISASINRLEKYDFVFNDLYLIDKKKDIIQKSFYKNIIEKKEYKGYLEIIDRNLFGLGNTAAKIDILKDLFIPEEIIAVDWWIFSILLLKLCKGAFVEEAITYYRQHDDNLIGMSKKLNKTVLRQGIKVKQIHYKNLFMYCQNQKMKEAAEIYFKKSEEIDILNKSIQDDNFCKRYIRVINQNHSKLFNGWWSDILSIREWRKYDQ